MSEHPRGRRDWDWVSFGDYEHDTREITERATYVIGEQRRQIDERERVIAALVLAAGGTITVPARDLGKLFAEHELVKTTNDCDMSVTFAVRRIALPAHDPVKGG